MSSLIYFYRTDLGANNWRLATTQGGIDQLRKNISSLRVRAEQLCVYATNGEDPRHIKITVKRILTDNGYEVRNNAVINVPEPTLQWVIVVALTRWNNYRQTQLEHTRNANAVLRAQIQEKINLIRVVEIITFIGICIEICSAMHYVWVEQWVKMACVMKFLQHS
jgi:hypothetical protein